MIILSLGAGVQSTTLALMAAKGEIEPMPDAAIFADTQWEPQKIYDHLSWLETQLPFPVHKTTIGSIREALIQNKDNFAAIPFFTESGGMGRRQCTREFKIDPIAKKQRDLLGMKKGEKVPKGIKVEIWIGISTDEAMRMKPSEYKWQENRWPLIEKRMSRLDCLNWLKKNKYPIPPKSSCIGCPYHSDSMWRDMRDNDPSSWEDAIKIDKKIRENGKKQYMHRSLKPLDEVEFAADSQLNFFNNECEGICGI